MRLDRVKRMKDMEAENARHKKQVADLSLDNVILREDINWSGSIEMPGRNLRFLGGNDSHIVYDEFKRLTRLWRLWRPNDVGNFR